MNDNDSARPPMPVWKLALLLFSTVGLYQFVWLYQTTTAIREARNVSLTPWRWLAVPLLGPLMAVPCYLLARHIKRWRIETESRIAYVGQPVLIGTLALAVFSIPALLILYKAPSLWWLVVAAAVTSVPYLGLQRQLNLMGCSRRAFDVTRSELPHAATVLVGGLVAMPLYAWTYISIWGISDATTLEPGDVVENDGGLFHVRIADDGWRQVEPGYLSDDSDLEFLGPDDRTWAIVYDTGGMAVDRVMAFRMDFIKEDYRGAVCTQRKTLVGDTLNVLGEIECTGRSGLDGRYVFTSRVLRDETTVIEILGSTSQIDPGRFDDRSSRVRRFIEGLELVP